MTLNFTQTMLVHCNDQDALIQLIADWDQRQASADITGYMGGFVLANRAKPGEYLMVGEFGMVDPDVPAAEEAMKNNAVWENEGWRDRLLAIIDGGPIFEDYDEVYRTA